MEALDGPGGDVPALGAGVDVAAWMDRTYASLDKSEAHFLEIVKANTALSASAFRSLKLMSLMKANVFLVAIGLQFNLPSVHKLGAAMHAFIAYVSECEDLEIPVEAQRDAALRVAVAEAIRGVCGEVNGLASESVEQAKQKTERLRQEVDRARQAAEQARQVTEQARQEAERARQIAEQERQVTERARQATQAAAAGVRVLEARAEAEAEGIRRQNYGLLRRIWSHIW
ncbi:MAG: DUF874 family protein [Puniceicoccales bacterium]|jgi:methyl-accepting chemotaxis protein|nr:DUF874 family protein [Puniceicoccales bacterium]